MHAEHGALVSRLGHVRHHHGGEHRPGHSANIAAARGGVLAGKETNERKLQAAHSHARCMRGEGMSALDAVNEAAARAIYTGETHVVVFVRGRILVCANRHDVVPHGSTVLEICHP